MGQTTEQIISLELPSSTRFLHVLKVTTEEILKRVKLDDKTREEVNLAVIEAGTNAIKHGNQEDLNKRARFEFTVQPDQIIIRVADQGSGFNREQVANPLAEENLLAHGGRGILLMETFMDSVTYEKSGKVIKMIKRLNKKKGLVD